MGDKFIFKYEFELNDDFQAYNKTYLYDYSEVFTPLEPTSFPHTLRKVGLGCGHSATRERWLCPPALQRTHSQPLNRPMAVSS